jgi:hypothetical protein
MHTNRDHYGDLENIQYHTNHKIQYRNIYSTWFLGQNGSSQTIAYLISILHDFLIDRFVHDSLSNNSYGSTNANNILNNDSSCTRTSNITTNSFSNSERNLSIFNKDNKSNDNFAINIYRYKFTNDFINELFKFSKIHQYDHRKDFKEAWDNWIEENDIIISEEIQRLKNLSYNGNILEKMFKSARYYFRKKNTDKKDPIKRRNYISINKDLIDAMDEYIELSIRSLQTCKPSDSFDEFCKIKVDLLKETVNILVKSGLSDVLEIKNKIKKTYKNRYFLIINK